MQNNRLLYRTAHSSSRGGFTLVELLVVIGIIAILAGVALGPITNGIKKAQESAGMQVAHSIGLAMYSAANDNGQTYPDKSGGSADAGNIAGALLAGGYVTDATIFGLSGDTAAAYVKVSSASNTATTIKAVNVSWDFACTTDGSGLSSTSTPYMPILWSTVSGGGTAPIAGTATNPVYGIPGAKNPFGTAGLAVFYINNAAAFVPATLVGGTTQECVVVTGASNLSGPPAKIATASGT